MKGHLSPEFITSSPQKQPCKRGPTICTLLNISLPRGGTTNTSDALNMMATMFTVENGDRPDAPNFALVITDGRSNNKTETYAAARAVKAMGVLVMVVGGCQGIFRYACLWFFYQTALYMCGSTASCIEYCIVTCHVHGLILPIIAFLQKVGIRQFKNSIQL